eukprot:TRINITY_DN1890_c0_g2_i2.p3 TRINITY_DN1890_c0_g2~~TRINITY_DN1890_c0_g2_i2.p3  ORF type:complete len:194 (-),score=53.95 TRINITY_DN1890_c0_g2_i2:660-1241(-)
MNSDKRILQYRLSEGKVQAEAILRGMRQIVPENLLSLFTWQEVELMICGSPEINLDLLKQKTEYGVDVSANDAHIRMFWELLEEFNQEERRLWLRFVWGRNRLPRRPEDFELPMKIHPLNTGGRDPNDYFPKSHTCFFSVEIPAYTSKVAMRQKITYAILNCTAIDADNTGEGRANLGLGFGPDGDDDEEEEM